MEIFLLLVDELDDLFHALRASLYKFTGFLIALSVFGAMVISAMTWPVTVASTAMLAALLLMIRNSTRDMTALRLKTDP